MAGQQQNLQMKRSGWLREFSPLVFLFKNLQSIIFAVERILLKFNWLINCLKYFSFFIVLSIHFLSLYSFLNCLTNCTNYASEWWTKISPLKFICNHVCRDINVVLPGKRAEGKWFKWNPRRGWERMLQEWVKRNNYKNCI